VTICDVLRALATTPDFSTMLSVHNWLVSCDEIEIVDFKVRVFFILVYSCFMVFFALDCSDSVDHTHVCTHAYMSCLASFGVIKQCTPMR
jgi:hypothetical protein